MIKIINERIYYLGVYGKLFKDITGKNLGTVYFEASKKGLNPIRIELSLNHQTKKYTLCTAHKESVSFKNDTIEISKLKLEAIKEAIKYIKQQLAS